MSKVQIFDFEPQSLSEAAAEKIRQLDSMASLLLDFPPMGRSSGYEDLCLQCESLRAESTIGLAILLEETVLLLLQGKKCRSTVFMSGTAKTYWEVGRYGNWPKPLPPEVFVMWEKQKKTILFQKFKLYQGRGSRENLLIGYAGYHRYLLARWHDTAELKPLEEVIFRERHRTVYQKVADYVMARYA